MEKLTRVLRAAIPCLVVLVLIPIVIYLWCGVFDPDNGWTMGQIDALK